MSNRYCARVRLVGSLAAAICVALAAGRGYADETTLADLLADPGASIISQDGLLKFSNFSYEPKLGAAAAPKPSAVRLITDGAVPDGFRVEGPFQVLNGVGLNITLGFTATSVTGAEFQWAGMTLAAASAFGFLSGPGDEGGALVRLAETITPFENGGQRGLETFLDASGAGVNMARVSLDPDVFGSSIRVSQAIELTSVANEGGSVAVLSVYTPGFGVVPEPMTLVLMLAAAPAALGCLRRRRVARSATRGSYTTTRG